MTSPASLLRLIWLASPALPVGGFSYSEGLEAAVEAGLVGSEPQASDWLLDQLQLTLARSDLAIVVAAFDAWLRHDLPRLEALDAWVAATRESRELRQQTEQMGRSLLAWLHNDGPRDDLRLGQLAGLLPTWPLAFALAASRSGATAEQAALSFAFGWAENAVQAAIRCVPLGQAAGQRILARLAGAIPAAVEAAVRLSDGDRQAFAPMLAILSARHEIQYSRLFRS